MAACGGKTIYSHKCCLWSTGLILAVILVVIPVAYFVIAPAMAQHIIYTSAIALPNSTMLPCSLPDSKTGIYHAWLLNTAKIHVPGFFTATLHPYKTELSTTTCGSGWNIRSGLTCENPKTAVLGSYMAPEMDLVAGTNHLTFNANMDLQKTGYLPDVVAKFMFPMFQFNETSILKIESNHIDVTAGLRLFGKSVGIVKIPGLKLKNVLTCKKVAMLRQMSIPASTCRDSQTSNDQNQPYEMQCTAGAPTTAPTPTANMVA